MEEAQLGSAQKSSDFFFKLKVRKKGLLLFHKIVPISQLHEKGFVTHMSEQ